MSLTQMIEVPANRRITLEVPREVPVGPVILTFTPKEPVQEPKKDRVRGCVKGDYWMAEDFNAPLKEREFGCVKGDYWMAEDFNDPIDDYFEVFK